MVNRHYIWALIWAFAGELLGFNQFIPPFATARGREILVGVNYASGSAGIRDETGSQLVPNNLRCSNFLPVSIFTTSYDLTSIFFFCFPISVDMFQGDRISLNEQLQNHAATFNRSIQLLGTKQAATNYLNKCLYYVSLGTNDYINNYFVPGNYETSRLYTPDQYAKVLIDQYSQQIKVGITVHFTF